MAIQEKRYKVDEFWQIANRPENQNKRLELIDGRIVEVSPSFLPSTIAGLIITAFNIYLRTNPIGYVTGADGGYILSDHNEYIPDVGYISKERLPELPEREVPVPPDLAVEVVSPTDSKEAVKQKARKYLISGTRMVWIVYPDNRTVAVCRLNKENVLNITTLDTTGTLDGGDVLPGFRLEIRDIFPD